MTRALLVFGAGPGIGDVSPSIPFISFKLTSHQAVAAKFATKGFNHIILLARNTQRLQNEDASFVSKASSDVKVDTIRIDLADLASIPGILKEIDTLTQGEDVEVIFFNAARIKPSDVLAVPMEEIHEDFKVPHPVHIHLTLLTISADHQPRPLHHRPTLHPQAPSPRQIQPIRQTRPAGDK